MSASQRAEDDLTLFTQMRLEEDQWYFVEFYHLSSSQILVPLFYAHKAK